MYLLEKFTIVVLVSLGVVYCSKTPELSDHKDFSEPAKKNYMNIIKEYNLDPLYKNKSEGRLSNLKYKLYDIYLYNLKKCKITMLLFNQKENTFEEKWDCPSFFLKFNNELNGTFVDVDLIDQKGYVEIKTGKFQITITGNFMVTERNKKIYNSISNPTIKTKAKENVIMQNYTLTQGDQAAADKARTNFNEKDQETGREFVEGLINELLMKFFDSLKDYIHNHSTDETLNTKKN